MRDTFATGELKAPPLVQRLRLSTSHPGHHRPTGNSGGGPSQSVGTLVLMMVPQARQGRPPPTVISTWSDRAKVVFPTMPVK